MFRKSHDLLIAADMVGGERKENVGYGVGEISPYPVAQTVLPGLSPRLLKPHRRLISGVSRRKSKEIMDEIVIR